MINIIQISTNFELRPKSQTLLFTLTNSEFMLTRFWGSLLFAVLLVFGTLACSSTETVTVDSPAVTFQPSAEEHRDESTVVEAPYMLKIGELEPVKSLDPLFALGNSAKRAVHLMYEGLTRLDANGQAQPAIAKSWEVSSDSLTYTFTLRSDAYFHDDDSFTTGFGRPVTADDVVFVFSRMTSRSVPPQAANKFRYIIKGFDAYYQQSMHTFFSDEFLHDSITGIEAKNDSTVTFTLNHKTSHFPELLAHPYASVYPNEVIRNSPMGLHNNPVGSGLFMLSHITGDSLITLERNFGHYDAERIPERLTSISIRIFRGERDQFNKLASGEITFIPETGPQTTETVVTDDNELMFTYEETLRLKKTGMENFYLYFQHNNTAGLSLSDLSALLPMFESAEYAALERIEFHYPETDTAAGIPEQTIRIGFEPVPVIDFTAKTAVRELVNEASLQLYPVRNINLDMVLYWSRNSKMHTAGLEKIGSFTYNRFALHSTAVSGLIFNEHPWWFSLRNIEITDEEAI